MMCSPIRVVLAIVIFLVMMAVYLFGLMIAVAVNIGISGNYSAVSALALWSWIILGPLAMLYVTYLVGFNCGSAESSKKIDV